MAKVKVEAEFDGSAFKAGLAHMNGEAERFSAELNRKFSAAKIFGSLLSGFGIGSGFAIAQAIADKITEAYKAAADEAQRMADASKDALDTTRAIIALKQNPMQQLSTAKKELSAAEQAVEKAKNTRTGSNVGRELLSKTLGGDFGFETDADHQDVIAAEKAYNVAREKVARLQDKVDKDTAGKTSADANAFTDRIRAEDKARADKEGVEVDPFTGIPTNIKKPVALVEAPKRNDDFRASISASTLASIGGGGTVNAIGPLSANLLAEAKIQTNLLRVIAAQKGPNISIGDIRR